MMDNLPPDSRFQENKAFLTRLWHLENEERPGFLIGYVGPEVIGGQPVASALFSTEGTDTVKDRLLDPEKYLQAQLQEIEGQLKLAGDFVPALCPSLGVVAIPSAFGCPVIWWERDFPAVKPIIRDQPQRVWDLEPPSVADGLLGKVLDYTRYFRQATGGRYPIRVTDIQGPLDSASLIWGHSDFLLAVYTHPREVHHLLQMVTDLTIDFVRAMREVAGDGFVPSLFQPWTPDGWAISVSNDECVMISPATHDEFSVPYLNQLSEAFGGLYMHSCGNWLHQLPSLEKVRNLRGVEFGASETAFPAVAERLGGKAVVACRVGFNQEKAFHGMADYVRFIQAHKTTNRGLFIHVDVTNGILGPDWPPTDLHEIYALLGSP